ncbi:MAG: hypothetical protein PHQ12_04780, partial [Chthoniobacteraceae bacterium]|nr:hypothetical protein [Chthoniobacteraceae bacterium]
MKKLFLLLAVIGINSARADIKISQLPPANSVNAGDLLYTVQSGVSKQITLQNFVASITLPAAQITGLAPVATSGSYGALLGLPIIPSDNNQLTNGMGFVQAATQTEVDMGTSTAKAVTPATLANTTQIAHYPASVSTQSMVTGINDLVEYA